MPSSRGYTGGFGTSVGFNPSFLDIPNDDTARLSFPFTQTVTARYVEVTITDNWFNDATGGRSDPPGGDRVGLGEIAFEVQQVTLHLGHGLAECRIRSNVDGASKW